jgi:hypothetical protein
MSDEKIWYLAFDHTPSYQTVRKFLVEQGSFVEKHEHAALMCPDGQPRPAIKVHHAVIEQVQDMTVEYSILPLRYIVLYRETKEESLNFWLQPPPEKEKKTKKKRGKKGKGLPEGVMTGAEFARRRDEMPPRG